MTNWIAFVQKHHDIIKLSDNAIKIPCIGYDIENPKRFVDHVITKHEGRYTVEEYYHRESTCLSSWEETSIKEYLGY